MKNTLQILAATALTSLVMAAPATAQLRITEAMGQASAGTASTLNGDWWELTNFGSSPVNLLGYQWADSEDALPSSDSNFFPSFTLDSGQSLILTYWPTEFSQVRGQFRRINFAEGQKANEFLFQFNFTIGAHGAHVF